MGEVMCNEPARTNSMAAEVAALMPQAVVGPSPTFMTSVTNPAGPQACTHTHMHTHTHTQERLHTHATRGCELRIKSSKDL